MSFDEKIEFDMDDEGGRRRERPRSSSSKKKVLSKKRSKPKTTKTSEKKKEEVEEVEEEERPPKKKATPSITAKRNPVPDGIKRKLAMDLREMKNLKKQLKELEDERGSYEHEMELLEDEIDSVRSEKERLEDEVNNKIALVGAYEKKLNRNQKDFDNIRKRMQSDVDRQVKQDQKKVLIGLIEIIDNLDRAILEGRKYDYKPEVSLIMDGLDSIKKNMLKVLSDTNVEMLDPINVAFDPHFHEAIDMVTDTSVPDKTVISVQSKGYVMGDIVLRPAKVNVSRGGEPRKKVSKKKEEGSEEEEIPDLDEVEEELEDIEELDSE
ncbi:MAG: nucleotide exchange factor GrpE [Candidatus Thermoplasmatota archaeon]|nr:nucleotide exchange factor GrpE [Candidatus Thermoplasmatota archaeon]